MLPQKIVRFALCALCLACLLGADGDAPALKYNDNMADGKKSYAGAGQMIAFTLPADGTKIAGVRIHGSRYGNQRAPRENFLIYFLNQDLSQILRTEMAPYSLFAISTEGKWVDVKFKQPIEMPKDITVVLDFRAHATKGIFVSYDTSTGGKYSKVGLPGIEAKDTDLSADWMIELIPAE